jgi:hypothetical protein
MKMAGELVTENGRSQSEVGMRKRKLGHGWASGNIGGAVVVMIITMIISLRLLYPHLLLLLVGRYWVPRYLFRSLGIY